MKDLFGNEEIRALWWKQPFGSLMLHGKVETRTWETKYRGLVLICTTSKPYHFDKAKQMMGDWYHGARAILIRDETAHLNGYAIALGRLRDCRRLRLEDRSFVFPDPFLYAHIYHEVRRIEPFPLKGAQGWRKVTDEVKSKIKFI